MGGYNMKLKPYPKYKDSRVQWIGKIPEGWEVKRLRFNALVNPSGKKALSNPNTLVNFLPMEKVSGNGEYEQESEAEYQDVSTGYTYFEDNDVLVAKITPCFENGKGALVNNLKFGFGFGTTEFHVIRSHSQLMPKYLFYLTKTHLFRVSGEAFMEGAAGQKRVSTDFIKDFMMATPPLPDQTTIASFLDKRTTRIDAMIEKDKKLITLLKEKRTALINHAVTKGLDKNAKMKKVNLLICDETPENWQVIRIKFVIRLSRGVDLSNDDFEEGNIPVYGSNGIIGYHNEATSKGPGVTVGRSGSVGEVNFVNEERYWAHNTSLYLQEDYGNNVRYIYYLLSILDLKHLAAGSAVGTLNRNYIHDLFVSLPSKQEQQKIVEYLNKATSKIDKTIKVIEKKIKLLEEYKKSLVNHVVTGKVDARGVEV
jgi:type I restriction enzyme S subunit